MDILLDKMAVLLERHAQGYNKCINQCTLCHRKKAKVQAYPLQKTDIPKHLFGKIAIDLVTECETSSSGNKHILIIIDHLT